jgi:hypothetical protein
VMWISKRNYQYLLSRVDDLERDVRRLKLDVNVYDEYGINHDVGSVVQKLLRQLKLRLYKSHPSLELTKSK